VRVKIVKALFAMLRVYACILGLLCLTSPVAVKTGLASWFDFWNSIMALSCQQVSTRTFWLFGYPMACCARCLGIYLGIGIPIHIRIPHWVGTLALLEKPMEYIIPLFSTNALPENVLRFVTAWISVVYLLQLFTLSKRRKKWENILQA